MAAEREPEPPIYVATGVSKRYGGVQALAGVDLELHAGEVHALLGANGAGKSTLVKILAGAEEPSSGSLELGGEPVAFANPEQAARRGVALVSQELTLFPDLDCLHNLFLMREPRLARILIRRREMRRRAQRVVEMVGLDVDLDRRVGDLRLGERQLVEIARALLGEPSILILDEPTSALQAAETARLLDVVRLLRDDGVAVVFVSHFLEDVFAVADSVTILRSGQAVIGRRPAAELTVSEAIREMLGPAASHASARPQAAKGEHAAAGEPLTVRGLSIPGKVDDVDLVAAPGELVGVAGLDDSGAQAVLRALFGEGPATGSVSLPGGGKRPRSRTRAVKAGIAYLPADRKGLGLMLRDSVADNMTLVTAGPLGRYGPVPATRRRVERARHWEQRLGITMSSPRAPADSLSGGNQQKVVFAKWLDGAPSILLFDDPTRGVDVGAKAEMQRLMREIASEGRVVVYTSNDFEEMAAICDRIYVFFAGRIVGSFEGAVSEHALLEAVTTGVVRGGAESAGSG